MKVGILSDAHGHVPAFELALDTLRDAGAERLFFLGDAVGYIPEPRVAELLLALDIPYIKGNHEAMMLAENYAPEREAIYRLGATRAALSPAALASLNELDAAKRETVGGVRCMFVHGSPADPTYGYVYPDTDLSPFAAVEADAVFMGHSHRPFVRESGGKLFVNAGSCALPRDDDRRGAACLFDTGTRQAKILRFDISTASRKVLAQYDLHESVIERLRRTTGTNAHV